MVSSFSTTATPEGSLQETDVYRYCEPYVLVTRVDLGTPQPELEVRLYGSWHHIEPEDSPGMAPLVWGQGAWNLEFISAPIAAPDDVIFLIALMEHFDGNPSALRVALNRALVEGLDASAHLERETRISRAIDEMDKAIQFTNGGPNFTSTVKIPLTTDAIMDMKISGYCRFQRSFCGYGGQYCISIELIKAEPGLWSLVPQQDEAFACAAE
jgi:hypothetical protein